MARRISQALALALLGMAVAFVLTAYAGAQETTPDTETTTLPTTDTFPTTETSPTTETTTETTFPTTTPETTTAAATSRVDLETWEWALLAAGATAAILLVFALGRASRREKQRSGERTPAERNQTLLAALSGWLAEGWVVESQSSTEAVVRKGSERRLLSVDLHGSLSRSELPPAEPDPRWTAPSQPPPGE